MTRLKHDIGRTTRFLCFSHPSTRRQRRQAGTHGGLRSLRSLRPLPLHSSGGGQAPVRACLPPLPPLPSRLEWKLFQSWSGPKSPNLVLASSKMFWRSPKSRFSVLDRIPQHGYSTPEEKWRRGTGPVCRLDRGV